MNRLKVSDMSTVELSIDQVGKILFYENRIFRAINDDYVDQVKNMFECGLIDEITTKKLFPKSWISDIAIEGYSLVIEHEKIDYWNYPYEWSFDMLKDAALLILQVNKIANKYGYQLMDSHSSNVVFNMNKPQYTDLGSFGKLDHNNDSLWKSYNIFYNHFYIPLYLISKGYSDIGRNVFLMMNYFNEQEFLKIKYPILSFLNSTYIFTAMGKIKIISLSSEEKIKNKLGRGFKQSTALLLHKVFKNSFSIDTMEEEISYFSKPLGFSTWYDYHDDIDPKTNKRFLRIVEIINNMNDAKSLLEVASNQGKLATYVLENTHIEKLIATDYDREAVNIMYLKNKNRNNFLPLLFDMIRTNGRKYDDYLYNRIKSDIVMGLAVTHHLILTQQIPIDNIFKTMQKLTNKYIIVEFMPLGLYSGDMNKIQDLPSYYNLDWFREKFMHFFDLILEEDIDINRYVFVGKLKKLQEG
jgi:hypothetical protein